MSDVHGVTFANNRDRITYLIGEYRVPLSIVTLAGSIWMVAFVDSPTLPTPPDWMLASALSSAMLAFPAFFLAKKVVSWLYSPDMVRVGVIDEGHVPDDPDAAAPSGVIAQAWRVPRDTWDTATVTAYPPVRPDDDAESDRYSHFDYIVTRFNWYADIGELEVRGAERADLPPGEAMRSAARTKEVHDHLHVVRRQFAELKADVSRRVTEAHDSGIMALLAELERAELVDGAGIAEDLVDEDGLADPDDAPAADPPQTHPERLFDGEVPRPTAGRAGDGGQGPAPAATDGGEDRAR